MVVAITMIVMAITIIVMAIISSLLKRFQKILFADRGRQVANLPKKSKERGVISKIQPRKHGF